MTADDLADLYAQKLESFEQLKEDIETIREMFAVMRKDGIISDEVIHPKFTLKWQTRSSWVYSAAVKQVQQLEQVEGIATKKTSEGWVVRKASAPQF